MQTLNLRIEESFFPQFRAIIDEFVKEHKVEVIDNDEEYDYENNYPQSVVISSVEEVRRRVYEAEKRIKEGDGMSEEEYETFMDKFFKEELGIDR
ncbi:MAG: hypothetical protein JXQ76_07060 [Campylobacterales bacterium]|nr:hypothetical protein [Campylobacterales bacterium]